METAKTICALIENENELKECITSVDNTFQPLYVKCFQTAMAKTHVKESDTAEIDTILDFLHDELNTGHWSKVPIEARRAFTAVSFAKALLLLKTGETGDVLKRALKCIDVGLLLGAPLIKNPELLSKCATHISEKLKVQTSSNQIHAEEICDDSYRQLPGLEVDAVERPDVETFRSLYYELQVPAKLTNCVMHWSALTKWRDVSYLLKVAGHRTIPVEIGSSYTDENWSQKLMTLQEFVERFYSGEGQKVGYLAQHNLFDQIPELKFDIHVPDYCCFSRDYENSSQEPDINAWFGPKGTVSPLHHDLKDNLLTQVFGTKQIILFSPKDTKYLCPYEDRLLNNTSPIDPIEPDLKKYPEFKHAKMYKCWLQPGEMLYIPPKWWHHVKSFSKSFSVSFWWD